MPFAHHLRTSNPDRRIGLRAGNYYAIGACVGLIYTIVCSCRSKQVIRDAIMDNNFLKNLDSIQVREIVDCMYEKRVKTGQYVIKEGDPGQHFYVAAGTLFHKSWKIS